MRFDFFTFWALGSLVVLAALLASCTPPETEYVAVRETLKRGCEPAGFPTTYDAEIQKAWVGHGPMELKHRHCGFRAQLAAESSLNPEADSGHAKGVSQTTEAASQDCRSAGLVGVRVNPKFSIACGAWLLSVCFRVLAFLRCLSIGE